MQQVVNDVAIGVLTCALIGLLTWAYFLIRRGMSNQKEAQSLLLSAVRQVSSGLEGVDEKLIRFIVAMDGLSKTIYSSRSDLVTSLGPLLIDIRDRDVIPPGLGKQMEALADALAIATPSLGGIADQCWLIAKGTRDMSDQVATLRAVVFGGGRAEEFAATGGDDSAIRRGNMEGDIQQLMIDHKMSRNEAEKRIKDAYAGSGR